jgi:4a-hydroxytetrahydrobiopterin dehydratase
MELKHRHCSSIPQGTHPRKKDKITSLIGQLSPGWTLIENRKIKKAFSFEKFKKGMTFAQVIALIAEKENHHPEICVSHQQVEIILSTQSIGGLSENDFIMAAKFDSI